MFKSAHHVRHVHQDEGTTARDCSHPSCSSTVSKLVEYVQQDERAKGNKYKCISFSGAGFLILYHLGVAWSIVENAYEMLQHTEALAGASAGGLVTTMLGLAKFKGKEAMDIERCKQFALDLAELNRTHHHGIHQLTPRKELVTHLRDFLDSYLPADAHHIFKHKCFFSITELEQGVRMKNELVCEFKDRDELLEVLLGSCYIPGYFGFHTPHYQEHKIIDGGFTGNLPIPPYYNHKNTIRVSPYPAKVDIHPSYEESPLNILKVEGGVQYVLNKEYRSRSAKSLNPPSAPKLLQYFDGGYADALRFLEEKDLCDKEWVTHL